MWAADGIRGERGQSSPEWLGLVLVVAALLTGLPALAAPLPIGVGLARALGARLICAVDLSETCEEVPELVAAFGEELAKRLRDHAPTIFYEHGMSALPVDFRSCRSPACGDGAADGLVSRTLAGDPASVFVHVVDCRSGAPAPFDGPLPGAADCSGPRAGNLYLQYWLYYADSATLRGIPVAGARGFHADDWESYQVRIGPDGKVDARASSHNGYNYGGGPRNWGSDLGWGAVLDTTEALGLRRRGAWGPETGMLVVSGGSHAGNVHSMPCCRITPAPRLALIPSEPFADGEEQAPHFAIPPPWRKHVWRDPESEDTG